MAVAELGDIAVRYEWDGAGETVLLVSGLGGALSYWAPNREALSSNSRLLLHDHRGTGETTPWVGEYSVELLADDLLRLMDKLGVEKAHLVGHSTGGAIGQVLAAKAPDRIASLVLYATWCTLDPQMALCFDIRRKLLRLSVDDYHRAAPLFLYPPYYVRDHWGDLEMEIAANAAAARTVEIIDARIRAVLAFDGKPYLGSISCPTLVVVAADDILTPPYSSEEVASGIRGARLVKFPRGAHLVSRVEPAAFNEVVLDFLNANRMSVS